MAESWGLPESADLVSFRTGTPCSRVSSVFKWQCPVTVGGRFKRSQSGGSVRKWVGNHCQGPVTRDVPLHGLLAALAHSCLSKQSNTAAPAPPGRPFLHPP